MIKTRTIAAVAVASILSIGSAFADSNRATIVSSQFGSAVTDVQTSTGNSGAVESGMRQVAQPNGWVPVMADHGGH